MSEILILNHDPQFLALMDEFLTGEGYRVTTWYSIERVLEHVQISRPDLIIVDLHLERREPSWSLVEALRRDSAISDVPLVVTSTQPTIFRHGHEMLEQGGIVSLGKPFELVELLAIVQRLIPGESDGLA